ncbi:hypothetical protein CURTO8I2_70345 [Curtobacterium sp. 8I-2]|nr:hypothetical protein CURTO8I2_70345 [Curtobacterium sp. 8I-2]
MRAPLSGVLEDNMNGLCRETCPCLEASRSYCQYPALQSLRREGRARGSTGDADAQTSRTSLPPASP